jgi:hypothetical protein
MMSAAMRVPTARMAVMAMAIAMNPTRSSLVVMIDPSFLCQ